MTELPQPIDAADITFEPMTVFPDPDVVFGLGNPIIKCRACDEWIEPEDHTDSEGGNYLACPRCNAKLPGWTWED